MPCFERSQSYATAIKYGCEEKASIDRLKNTLSFHPHHNVRSIVGHLIENMNKCNDWDNPNYYNIKVFKQREEADNKEPVPAASGA